MSVIVYTKVAKVKEELEAYRPLTLTNIREIISAWGSGLGHPEYYSLFVMLTNSKLNMFHDLR